MAIFSNGSGTNIDLELTPKGTGRVEAVGPTAIQEVFEKATVTATAATGTENI
jgi:hypothetical protein